MGGFELRPLASWECYIELRGCWLGFGQTRFENDREVYLGFVQITLSRVRGRRSRPSLVVPALALAVILTAGAMVKATTNSAPDDIRVEELKR